MSGKLAAAQAAHQLQMQSLTETEKEKRVAHLQQQAARRIANRGVAKGFTTWQGQWEEAARQKRMLAAAAGRLARPALAVAVAHWVGDWHAAESSSALRAEAARERRLSDSATFERQMLQVRAHSKV